MIDQLYGAFTNTEVWSITLNTIKITGLAVLLALVAGLPLSFALAFYRFPLKKLVIAMVNTAMGLPPVIAGLLVSMVFWRSGIFGHLDLLYTPTAMVIAEFIITLPIVSALSFASLKSINPEIKEQFHALGANKWQVVHSLLRESRLSTTAAVIAGYGAIVSEVGAALMVGGNIRGETRVLTTAIVMETRKGNFDYALALGLILLAIAFIVNFYMTGLQQKDVKWKRR